MTRSTLITLDEVEALRRDLMSSNDACWTPSWENRDRPDRMILKARQVGATHRFAKAAFLRACDTGRHLIVLSASRAAAQIYHEVIAQWLAKVVGVALTGPEPSIRIPGTPSRPSLFYRRADFILSDLAQAIRADILVDEYFWIHGIRTIERATRVVAPEAMGYTRTWLSSMGEDEGPAWDLWSGASWNRAQPSTGTYDVALADLTKGALGPDGIWRQVISIHDVSPATQALFDLEELRRSYGEEDFSNLFLCRPMVRKAQPA